MRKKLIAFCMFAVCLLVFCTACGDKKGKESKKENTLNIQNQKEEESNNQDVQMPDDSLDEEDTVDNQNPSVNHNNQGLTEEVEKEEISTEENPQQDSPDKDTSGREPIVLPEVTIP